MSRKLFPTNAKNPGKHAFSGVLSITECAREDSNLHVQ